MILRALSATTLDFSTILLSKRISWGAGDAGRLFNIPLLGVLLKLYLHKKNFRVSNSRHVNGWVSWGCNKVLLILTLTEGDADNRVILFWLLRTPWVTEFWFPQLKGLFVFPNDFLSDIRWDMGHLFQIYISLRFRIMSYLQRAVSATHYRLRLTRWLDTKLTSELREWRHHVNQSLSIHLGLLFEDYPFFSIFTCNS